ncbi:putative cupredoxin-like copper-binding protein [Dysgonomonadaceae bacterium PH5-43]|nr:putative cupredoxin-like copper-binding protein [Dysgonomonadaceae bacterium PH5-43]
MKSGKLIITNIFSWAVCALLAVTLTANKVADDDTKKEENEKVITVDKLVHDFKTIKELDGEVKTTFTFTNKMDTPFSIDKVIAQCGCSKTTWTKTPIEPGKTGEVEVVFDPNGLYGVFDKNLTVVTNGTPNRITIKVKGIIE